MNSRNLFCILLALPMLLSQARAADRITKETIESQGKKRTYYLMVPDSAKSSASAPLIVLLHGSGRNGLSLMEKWKELASSEGVIIAGPDSRDSQGWQIPADGPGFIYDLVEALKTKYPINPRRVYLFGHSAGAVFALNLRTGTESREDQNRTEVMNGRHINEQACNNHSHDPRAV
jgi:poly(3-hydroxybutyrate) depolymerase